MIYTFQVNENAQKLAPFLKGALPQTFSLKWIKKTIERGACRVNGRVVSYSNHQLQKKDRIEIALSEPQILKPKILFEDAYFWVIDKPSGLESLPAPLEKALGQKIFLVHRLDKETSGLLILAKTSETQKKFETLFRERSLIKRYLGIVDGLVRESEGTLESKLDVRSKGHHALYVAQSAKGACAITHWKKRGMGSGASLIEFEILTGKTHQIRAQAKQMQHPILGDPIYAKKPGCKVGVERLMLHAVYLEFDHPVLNTPVRVSAPLPKAFMDLLKKLGISSEYPNHQNL